MRKTLAMTAFLFAVASATSAKADPYRWCAQDMGQSGSSNCYFLTLEQCRAAVSGAGSFCTPNTFYTGSDSPGAPRSRRR